MEVFFYVFMSDEIQSKVVPSPGVTKNRVALYQKIAKHEDKIIKTLLACLDSRIPMVQIGAAKTLLSKILPDVKAVEITGKDGEPIKFNVVTGADYLSYISRLREINASSDRSIAESPREIQSIDMAQTSKKDNNSNHTVS